MKVRRFAYVAGVSAAALMLAEACSDAVGEMMVDAGVVLADAGAGIGDTNDAGRLLRDAGQALADAGQSLKDVGSEGAAQNGASSKSGSRIEMRRFSQAGADGSIYESNLAPFDTQLKVPCSIQRASDGKLRCMPSSSGQVADWFADAQCTQRVGFSTDCEAGAGSYVFKYESGTCGTGAALVRAFALGPAFTGATLYQKSGATCTSFPSASLTGYRLFTVGAEVPAASFVEFSASQSAT